MAEREVVDGIVQPSEEDEQTKVILPTGFMDVVITKPHTVVVGESVVTCNMVVQEPLKKLGQDVVCDKCQTKFKVVRQEDLDK
jgi:hypothetical protein